MTQQQPGSAPDGRSSGSGRFSAGRFGRVLVRVLGTAACGLTAAAGVAAMRRLAGGGAADAAVSGADIGGGLAILAAVGILALGWAARDGRRFGFRTAAVDWLIVAGALAVPFAASVLIPLVSAGPATEEDKAVASLVTGALLLCWVQAVGLLAAAAAVGDRGARRQGPTDEVRPAV